MSGRDTRVVVDAKSLLAEVPGDVTVAEVEASLAHADYTLCLDGDAPTESVARWLAEGARGARSPWDDPADHLVAGFQAKPASGGEPLRVRAAPRKSVGPDLLALVLGMRERFFVITHATLRIFPRSARTVHEPFVPPSDAPVTPEEAELLDRIAAELERR